MVQITLGDYLGFIFVEVVKAREMADKYSRAVADEYAKDQVLQNFSVPRFKLPRMNLTIPVLLSDARMSQGARFTLPAERFAELVTARAIAFARAVSPRVPGSLPGTPVRPGLLNRLDGIQDLVADFHAALVANPDPLQPESLVTEMWGQVVDRTLTELDLVEAYDRLADGGALLDRTTRRMIELVQGATSLDRTVVESLLVDPQTHVVAEASTDATVFTIKAELLEDAFYLRWARDDAGGPATPIVEFE